MSKRQATTLMDFFQSTSKQARVADPTQSIDLEEEEVPQSTPETAEYAMQ